MRKFLHFHVGTFLHFDSSIYNQNKIVENMTMNYYKIFVEKNFKLKQYFSQDIKQFCNAYLFYKVKIYDIKGKKYLVISDKDYLSDVGFRYSVLGERNFAR